jgi:hypothetical protein
VTAETAGSVASLMSEVRGGNPGTAGRLVENFVLCRVAAPGRSADQGRTREPHVAAHGFGERVLPAFSLATPLGIRYWLASPSPDLSAA